MAPSGLYDQLVDATIDYLEALRSRGVRYLPPEDTTSAPEENAAPESTEPLVSASDGATVVVANAAAAKSIDREPSLSGISTEATSIATARTPEAKSQAMAALRERALQCVLCPHLASSRKSVVFGVGNLDAALMFVGEAPGIDEDLQGEPFVGRAGELLTKIIQTMGLRRSDVYIANILKCRPDTPGQPTGNRKPTPDEMRTCIPYLHDQIDLIQPRALVALGATAVEGLLGKTEGITRLRGHWREYLGIPLMPTYHPAFLLRRQTMADKRLVWEDMLQVMERLNMPISEKQRAYFTKD